MVSRVEVVEIKLRIIKEIMMKEKVDTKGGRQIREDATMKLAIIIEKEEEEGVTGSRLTVEKALT